MSAGNPYTATLCPKLITGMKKLFLLIAMLAMFACRPAPRTQEVVFQSRLVESGSMTRATDHAEVLDLIQSTFPTVSPTLYYDDNTSLNITLGQAYMIKVGTWNVRYANNPNTMDEVLDDSRLTLEPVFSINTDVTIQYGVSVYELPVEIQSVAFVYQIDEVERVYYLGKNSATPSTRLNFGVSGAHYCVFFMSGEPAYDEIFEIQVNPSDPSKKITTFRFSFTREMYNGQPLIKLKNGTYYVLHPEGVSEVSGSFSTSIPAWTCGLE